MNVGVIAVRVYAGIAEMDRQHGEQWVWEVDPDSLDMSDGCGCVVGQMFSDDELAAEEFEEFNPYNLGIGLMDLEDKQVQCGFNIDGIEIKLEGYAVLTRMWAYAIRRLRQLRSPQGGAS